MKATEKTSSEYSSGRRTNFPKNYSIRRGRDRRLLFASLWAAAIVIIVALLAAWIGGRASVIKTELDAASELIPSLREQIASDNSPAAIATVSQIKVRTAAAKAASEDPVWSLASTVPLLGANFRAVSEVARSADDVARLGLAPLVNVFGSLNWDALVPSSSGTNLEPLRAAAPNVTSSAYAVHASSDRLKAIDKSQLLPEVAGPLSTAVDQLDLVSGALDSAADAASIAPAMLGIESPRTYLLIIQNNAESRASGGIPGAVAVLNLENGKLSLGAQSSAGDIGAMTPALPVDTEQQVLYSSRLGKFMQDINLTPDFPTTASTAQRMWELTTGQRVDGVISIDPVVLSYILQATGPITVAGPDVVPTGGQGLPTELNSGNVVATLLSDVYQKIEQPKLQDAYFAMVAREIFTALASGNSEAKGLITGITRGVADGRVLVWSSSPSEQSVIHQYAVSGSIAGPSVSPAQFGVYFNDGTGAKMDYYVKRTVQLVKECSKDGYEQTNVRVTSTNTAPADAATSLPPYVTGAGVFGVPPGVVQTNIVAYGPAQANVESVKLDGQRTDFAPYRHANRPVGVYALRLAPGESKTIEFTFGKIVQHTEPNLVVTPTVQPVKDVTLPTENARCTQG